MKIGIPYGRSDVDEVGLYVQCPVCSWKCRGYLQGPVNAYSNEDSVTKGAAQDYAEHYAFAHEGR